MKRLNEQQKVWIARYIHGCYGSRECLRNVKIPSPLRKDHPDWIYLESLRLLRAKSINWTKLREVGQRVLDLHPYPFGIVPWWEKKEQEEAAQKKEQEERDAGFDRLPPGSPLGKPPPKE